MALTRSERIALHKKQERINVASGVPIVGDLTEGIPVLRLTSEGIVQYVRYNGVLWKSIYSKA